MAFKCGRCLRLFDNTPSGTLTTSDFNFEMCNECNGEVRNILSTDMVNKQNQTANLVAAQKEAQAIASTATIAAVNEAGPMTVLP